MLFSQSTKLTSNHWISRTNSGSFKAGTSCI